MPAAAQQEEQVALPTGGSSREVLVTAPRKGILEGIPAASPLYPDEYCPALENLRVVGGLLQTRLGSATWLSGATVRALGGSGNSHYLAHVYRTSLVAIRLGARGGTLYDLLEGTDTQFQAVSGGTGLATNILHGVTMDGLSGARHHYLTDQSGTLRGYDLATRVLAAVVSLTPPAVAPTCSKRTFRYLENWRGNSGAAPFGWTESHAATFNITASANTPPVDAAVGESVKLTVVDGALATRTILEDVSAGEPSPSNTVAFWVLSETAPTGPVDLLLGNTGVSDVVSQRIPERKGGWQPVFFDIGFNTTLYHKRFKVDHTPTTGNKRMSLGRLMLPGYLEGGLKYVYTYYDSVTGGESGPSPSSVMDFNLGGVSNLVSTSSAMQKSASMRFTQDPSGLTSHYRIYRSGGVPELTVDESGVELFLHIATVPRLSTTLNGSVSLNATTITVADATGITATSAFAPATSISCYLVLNPGGANEEFVQVKSVASNTLTLWDDISVAHSTAETVTVAYIDNVSNALLGGSTSRLDLHRDAPPTAIKWLARSPDGRLWAANWTDASGYKHPGGLAISNKPTPSRLRDYEIFPDGVDPLTTRDPIQGFRLDIPGEEITWFGFFAGMPTAFTRSAMYIVRAYSQSEYGPTSLIRHLETGCISGESVAEIDGALYWVAPGPRVVRWTGGGEPTDIGFLKLQNTLRDSPAAYWASWFGRAFHDDEGAHYWLWMTPSGATTNTLRLEYSLVQEAWGMSRVKTSAGADIAWSTAAVARGGNDLDGIYAAGLTGGTLRVLESGDTDATVAISTVFRSRRFPLGSVVRVERYHLRLARVRGECDAFCVQVTAGGSEYGDTVRKYSHELAGSGDLERKQRTHFSELKGRWVEVEITGDVLLRPAIREIPFYVTPIREDRITA